MSPQRVDSRTIRREWSPVALFIAGWLHLVCGLIGTTVWTRAERRMRSGHPLVWAPFAGGLLGIAVTFGVSYVQSLDHQAVVVVDRVAVRAVPNHRAASDTTLSEGTLLSVYGCRERRTEVVDPDGGTGWVPTQAVGDI